MTEEQMELARAFVALPNWRWMPGMRGRNGTPDVHWVGRVYRATKNRAELVDECCGSLAECQVALSPALDLLPDLDDPATLGCILALVREGRDADVWLTPPQRRNGHRFAPDDWCCWKAQVYPTLNSCIGRGATEAEALYAALEAAP